MGVWYDLYALKKDKTIVDFSKEPCKDPNYPNDSIISCGKGLGNRLEMIEEYIDFNYRTQEYFIPEAESRS